MFLPEVQLGGDLLTRYIYIRSTTIEYVQLVHRYLCMDCRNGFGLDEFSQSNKIILAREACTFNNSDYNQCSLCPGSDSFLFWQQ